MDQLLLKMLFLLGSMKYLNHYLLTAHCQHWRSDLIQSHHPSGRFHFQDHLLSFQTHLWTPTTRFHLQVQMKINPQDLLQSFKKTELRCCLQIWYLLDYLKKFDHLMISYYQHFLNQQHLYLHPVLALKQVLSQAVLFSTSNHHNLFAT